MGRLTVFFVVVLFAGACGDSADTTTTTEAPEATTATTQPPATTDPPATTQATTTTMVEVAPTATGPETVSFIALDYSSQPDKWFRVTADGGGAPETPDTPLFRRVNSSQHVALLAPDGHQLTRAEWATAEGSATITCEEGGTRYDIEFTGLIPNGVYTIWHVPTTEPITSRLPSGQIEDPVESGKDLDTGALGNANGDENAFTADAEGNGALNVLAAERDRIPKCTLVGGTFLVLLYHIDNRTWGSQPGHDSTNASPGVFSYPPLQD